MRPTTHCNILTCLALLVSACSTRTYAQDALELFNNNSVWYELRHFNVSAALYRSEGITTIEKSMRRLASQEAPYLERIALDSLGRIVRIEELRDGDSLEFVTTIAYRGKRMEPNSKTRCVTSYQAEWHTRYAFDRKGQLHKLKETTRIDDKVCYQVQYTIQRQANGLPKKTNFKIRNLVAHTTRLIRYDYVWKEQTRHLEVWEAGKLKLTFEMNADLDAISFTSANEERTNFQYENGRLIRMETAMVLSAKNSTTDYVYDDRGLLTSMTIGVNCPSLGCKEIRYKYLRD